jgi:hypothetical protein
MIHPKSHVPQTDYVFMRNYFRRKETFDFHRRGSRAKRYTISKQGVKNKRQKKKRYMDE